MTGLLKYSFTQQTLLPHQRTEHDSRHNDKREMCEAHFFFFFTDLKCILRADYPVTLSIQRIETGEKDDMLLNPLLKKKESILSSGTNA